MKFLVAVTTISSPDFGALVCPGDICATKSAPATNQSRIRKPLIVDGADAGRIMRLRKRLPLYRLVAHGGLVTNPGKSMTFTHFRDGTISLGSFHIPVIGLPLIRQKVAEWVGIGQKHADAIFFFALVRRIYEVVPVTDFHSILAIMGNEASKIRVVRRIIIRTASRAQRVKSGQDRTRGWQKTGDSSTMMLRVTKFCPIGRSSEFFRRPLMR